MTGAIASVACANGKIHHFVCVKKDCSLGHIIATFDDNDNVTWSMGDLTGQAHPKSQIAIGCPNPIEDSPSLDLIYQNPSADLVTMGRDGHTQQWSNKGESWFIHLRELG